MSFLVNNLKHANLKDSQLLEIQVIQEICSIIANAASSLRN
jgi:hypothetical protein